MEIIQSALYDGMMRESRHATWLGILSVAFLACLFGMHPAQAATPPFYVEQAVVLVTCGDRQGSGTVVNGDQGYVFTNAHVVADVATGKPAAGCTVGFLDAAGGEPVYVYQASIIHWVYDDALDEDFAILQIGKALTGRALPKPFPFLKTFEFSAASDTVTLMGYSNPTKNSLEVKSGLILGFEKGFIKVSAPISNGDSGGAAVNAQNELIGAPTRIVTYVSKTETRTDYEIVDIRSVMNWLDTYGPDMEDKYFTHADYARYHQSAVFVTQDTLGCQFVVRSSASPAVSCILPNDERWIFPNAATFLSWYPDFSSVMTVVPDTLQPFKITRNVTFRPGTLVKSQSSPAVYVVIDTFGTLRWIPSEYEAQTIWGPNWASLVHDVPDEFFGNYVLGQPLLIS